ncbi:MAG: hypothetical protein O2887_10105 [Bacteroidetes bacterium]|nr:hypothetical protein [Bacteroidota bacterium]MDA1120822.1 hypothetical protein [Bacteroidota bacterium]
MKSFILCFLLFVSSILSAQRSHEIQVQTGYYANWGVKFYDYNETAIRKHSYEFDHNYDASFNSISWHYPLNGFIDLGLYYSRSYDGSFEILQAEGFLIDSEVGSTPQADVYFSGLTDVESHYRSYGLDIRLNHLIRSNKYKFYIVISPGLQTIENIVHVDNIIEAQDPGLKEQLTRDFIGKEQRLTIGYGFGISYPLKNGINLKLIEIYDRTAPGGKNTNFLSSVHSMEVRIGASYQFYRRK